MFSNIFIRLKAWWRSVDKLLLLISLGLAVGIHIYVKSVNQKSKEHNKPVHVYLKEQGGSDESKETNCRRAQETNHRSNK